VERAGGRGALISRLAAAILPALRGGQGGAAGAGPAIRYLALGDSYTIGTGASAKSHNYPSILARRLTEATTRRVALTNPAVNGFTTLNLIEKELGHVDRVKPQLVTILIGVNDLVQGRTHDEYRTSLTLIYEKLAGLNLPAGHTVAISLPNWSLTPAASTFGDTGWVRRQTDEFNTIALGEAQARGFTWVDITPASESGMGSPGWIASDQLHPGDAQYAAWADVIWEAVRASWSAPENY
jgi:acyl-CoA thioesterase-1